MATIYVYNSLISLLNSHESTANEVESGENKTVGGKEGVMVQITS